MSLRSKGIVIFSVTILLIFCASFASLIKLRDQVLRNEAQAVADQVVSFRSWVAGTGMVWVNKLKPPFDDFLSIHEAMGDTSFYGKNPALATRELSSIANEASTRAVFTVTSDNVRQDLNYPDEFESAALEEFTENSSVGYVEGYEKGYYRYARPLYVKEGCLKCHGDPKDAPPAVIEKYGSEKAFHYKVGDVRGIISVKLPSLGFKEVLPTLANPWSVGGIVLAFLINFFFTNRLILRRLHKLTADTKEIVSGKLDTPLEYTPPEDSNDEVDQVYNSVDLLKRSMEMMGRKLRKKK
ncbi:MAG: DUF3365 domain-containing protein [Thermodesulfobacteriota bacterium]